MGCLASHLTLAFGIVREFGLLPVQRLQLCLGVAPATLVFGHGHACSIILGAASTSYGVVRLMVGTTPVADG